MKFLPAHGTGYVFTKVRAAMPNTCALRYLTEMLTLPVFDWLPDICVPTQCIYGTNDKIVNPKHSKNIAGAIPRAAFVAIEGAGHFPYLTHSEEFNPIMERFVVQHDIPPYCVKRRQQVISKICRLGGTAPELIESDLFDSHIVPMLQADFATVDNYHRAVPQVLPCPLAALAGRDDPDVTLEQARAWGIAAGGGFKLEVLEGEHFFLHSAHDRVIGIVNEVLGRHAPSAAETCGVAADGGSA